MPATAPVTAYECVIGSKLGSGGVFLTTAQVHHTAAAVSDRGRKRTSNEDAFGFSVEHGVFLVCDGMGGAAAGEIASALAVEELMRLLTSRAEAAPMVQVAQEAVLIANEAIFSQSQRNQKLRGMGTTAVGLLVEERHILVLNIGDSRCYRMRNGKLEQLTEDHSFVDEQVRLGYMTREQALRSNFRSMITRALGTQSQVQPDLFELEAEPDDLFLLCSDGLTRELSDSAIESLLGVDLSLKDLCTSLVSAANKAGGHDNITCILVRAGE
jgi:protein phosphatase